MKNEIFYPTDPSDKLPLPVPADTASGAPVQVGSLMGVTATAEGEGGNVDGNASVWLAGVFDLLVGTTTALAVGDPVYITGDGVLTPSDGAGANDLFGHAVEAKGTSPDTIRVKIAKV